MARRAAPEVNAGSMADIAFLLLIFFLVATNIKKDSGITRKLPPMEQKAKKQNLIKEKNILTVSIDKKNQLHVENEVVEIKDLRQLAIAFLENNADGSCSFCRGNRDNKSSDNPAKAVISLACDRQTSYKTYISVQNELVAAYNELRNRRALEIGPSLGFVNMNFVQMEQNEKDVRWTGDREKLSELINKIEAEIPEKLSEIQ